MTFASRELTDEELAEVYEGQEIPEDASRDIPVKNDADSYILDE
ncbi:hypothetical protein EVA_21460, partial [gut metagenome]